MSYTKTFTFDEFKAFINAQPDDKAINMNQSAIQAPVGCLLAQFGKSKGYENGSCGMSGLCGLEGPNREYFALDVVKEDHDAVYALIKAAIKAHSHKDCGFQAFFSWVPFVGKPKFTFKDAKQLIK